jgi:hypothetical protein
VSVPDCCGDAGWIKVVVAGVRLSNFKWPVWPRPVLLAKSASAFAMAGDRIASSWSRGVLGDSLVRRRERAVDNNGHETRRCWAEIVASPQLHSGCSANLNGSEGVRLA